MEIYDMIGHNGIVFLGSHIPHHKNTIETTQNSGLEVDLIVNRQIIVVSAKNRIGSRQH
jgi:hypothetical protein